MLSDSGARMEDFQSLFFKTFLEFQGNMLKSYQRILEEQLRREYSQESINNVAKDIMKLYSELIKLQREGKEAVVKMHDDIIIQGYVQWIEEALKSLQNHKG